MKMLIRLCIFTLALCAALMAVPDKVLAQTNVYITRGTSPQVTNIVNRVESISYWGDKAIFMRNDKQIKSVPIEGIRTMALSEQDTMRALVMPDSMQAEFDFDISFDDNDYLLAGISEPEVTDTKKREYDDIVEHYEWPKTITITYGAPTAKVDGKVDSVDVKIDCNHVVVNSGAEGVEYVLQGNANDGSFKIYSNKKTKVVLNNLKLTNPAGPVINSQKKKRIYLVLPENTNNVLIDGSTYKKVINEDQRGCVFSEGQICISGKGTLDVTGNKKSALASDEYIHILSGFVKVSTATQKAKTIFTKNLFQMGGGALQVLAEGNAAKGISSDSLITITGGKITVITEGDAVWDDAEQDYSSCCAIKSGYDMALTGGLIQALSTGSGGKGISAGSEEVITTSDGKTKTNFHGTLLIENAKIYVRTAGPRIPAVKIEDSHGDKVEAAASPKGIKAANTITINSGEVYVRAGGGAAAEGIESKRQVKIYDGKIRTYCVDDGMNAEGAYIYGGDIFLCSTDNDGFDVSFLYMYGGNLYSIGGCGDQMGLDTDGKTFIVNEGQITAIGARNCTPFTKSTQVSVLCYLKKNVSYLSFVNAKGEIVERVKTPYSYKPIGVLVSSAKLMIGETYKIYSYDKGLDSPAVLEYEFTPSSTSETLGSYK